MKRYSALLFLILSFGCSEDKRPEISTNDTPPKPVTDVQVVNIPGGAVLKYKLPDDEDLLFVKAEYSLKEGQTSEARASLYVDTLRLEGFGTEEEREVILRAVNRSQKLSDPVKVTIKPLEAPVSTIGKTMEMYADFGGVHIYWDNPSRDEISVVLEMEDNNREFVPYEVFYSTLSRGDVAARGLENVPYNFRAYVQDRWENKSASVEVNLTPYYEEKFDRLKFQALSVNGDEPSAWGWVLSNLFDGDVNTGFHTAQGTGRWPQWVTFDMGITGIISRIKTWQRLEGWEYRHGNPKKFELWGATEAANLADWSAWTKLMDCESIKPSGLPLGQLSGEDTQWATAGEEFITPLDNLMSVRYLRLKILENWSGGDFVHLMEVEVYGQPE